MKRVRCHIFTLKMFAGCLHMSKCIANCQYTRHWFLEQPKCKFFALLNLHWKLQTGQQDVVSFWTVTLYSTHKADFYDPLYKYTTQGFLYFGGRGLLVKTFQDSTAERVQPTSIYLLYIRIPFQINCRVSAKRVRPGPIYWRYISTFIVNTVWKQKQKTLLR